MSQCEETPLSTCLHPSLAPAQKVLQSASQPDNQPAKTITSLWHTFTVQIQTFCDKTKIWCSYVWKHIWSPADTPWAVTCCCPFFSYRQIWLIIWPDIAMPLTLHSKCSSSCKINHLSATIADWAAQVIYQLHSCQRFTLCTIIKALNFGRRQTDLDVSHSQALTIN